jgi:hypothetical protein
MAMGTRFLCGGFVKYAAVYFGGGEADFSAARPTDCVGSSGRNDGSCLSEKGIDDGKSGVFGWLTVLGGRR